MCPLSSFIYSFTNVYSLSVISFVALMFLFSSYLVEVRLLLIISLPYNINANVLGIGVADIAIMSGFCPLFEIVARCFTPNLCYFIYFLGRNLRYGIFSCGI